MKVLHVIQNLSRSGGGPSRSSQGLVAGLRAEGVDAWMLILSHGENPWIPGVERFINGGRIEDALEHVKPDIVHIHGLWGLGLHHCASVCRHQKIPYVIAPRGMLEPWSLKAKWLKKRVARFFYQDRDLKCAAALHATAESEAEQFRRLGFSNVIIISPNGVNIPNAHRRLDPSTLTREKRRALFVSRMHQKKGVMELVESWARVKPKGWQCELVYTTNGDEEHEYEQRVKDRIFGLGMSYQDKDGAIHSATTTSNADFLLIGPLNDDAKWDAYARADLFVLPTYSENFGIVVVEALWAGVPVITTKGTPWQDLVSSNCGWWIDLPPKHSLDGALRFATSSADLKQMGIAGRRLVEEKYTWKAACKDMVRGYEQILGRE